MLESADHRSALLSSCARTVPDGMIAILQERRPIASLKRYRMPEPMQDTGTDAEYRSRDR